MKEGMLWFDREDRPLAAKIEKAAAYYTNKYGAAPTVCFVHPTMLLKGTPELPGLVVRGVNAVLMNHFWLGIDEKARRDSDQAVPKKPADSHTCPECGKRQDSRQWEVIDGKRMCGECAARRRGNPITKALGRALAGLPALPAPAPTLLLCAENPRPPAAEKETLLEAAVEARRIVPRSAVDDLAEAVRFAVEHPDNAEAQQLPHGFRLQATNGSVWVMHGFWTSLRRVVASRLAEGEPLRYVGRREDIVWLLKQCAPQGSEAHQQACEEARKLNAPPRRVERIRAMWKRQQQDAVRVPTERITSDGTIVICPPVLCLGVGA